MPVVNHVLIAVSYAIAAAAVSIALPLHVAGVDPLFAVQVGMMLLIGCGLVHVASARLGREQAVTADLAMLGAGQVELRDELARARQEARRIHDAIQAASEARRSRVVDLDTVMTEVRVLHNLVEQLSRGAEPAGEREDVGEPRAVATGARPVPRVIESPGEAEVLDIVREGLRANRVDLYVQPIVSLPQRKRRHYECFSRIRADDHSMLVPDQYIAVAERAGLIAAIDNMLLMRGVQLVRRVQNSRPDFGIFVNISGHTLADGRFFRDFVAYMAAQRDLASHLVFEFAQAHVGRLDEAAMLELERLARLGFRFSMDQVTDFALAIDALAGRHFRFIKIEAARLLAETRAEQRRLDMRAFKDTLDRHGMDLVVEKIESEQILVELLDLPIDFGQGYLFGLPRPSRES
ncbi:MAG: EAL domain-containing protein [Pseudomonadota bacterium]